MEAENICIIPFYLSPSLFCCLFVSFVLAHAQWVGIRFWGTARHGTEWHGLHWHRCRFLIELWVWPPFACCLTRCSHFRFSIFRFSFSKSRYCVTQATKRYFLKKGESGYPRGRFWMEHCGLFACLMQRIGIMKWQREIMNETVEMLFSSLHVMSCLLNGWAASRQMGIHIYGYSINWGWL